MTLLTTIPISYFIVVWIGWIITLCFLAVFYLKSKRLSKDNELSEYPTSFLYDK